MQRVILYTGICVILLLSIKLNAQESGIKLSKFDSQRNDNKLFVSVGGGLYFKSEFLIVLPGINLQANLTKNMSNSLSLRADIQYSYNPGPFSERQNRKFPDHRNYTLTFNLLAGRLNPEYHTNAYAFIGAGVTLWRWHDKSQLHKVILFGGGLSFKISDNFRIYVEGQNDLLINPSFRTGVMIGL